MRTLVEMLGWPIVVCMLMLVSACSGPSANEPERREIIDPKGTEFAQHLNEARTKLVGVQRQLIALAPAARVLGNREDISCVWGNKGPLGSPDRWDSQCEIQRTFGLLVADPIKAMFRIDPALRAQGWNGDWCINHCLVTVSPGEVRRGRVPPSKIGGASYGYGYFTDLTLQVGRSGERQQFRRDSLGVGYFHSTTGSDWESTIPRGALIKEPLIAVELTIQPFMRRPITA